MKKIYAQLFSCLALAGLLLPAAVMLHASEAWEEDWVEVGRSINIVNESFFPLKITYKKGFLPKTKYLAPDYGEGNYGPTCSIQDFANIKGPITVTIAMPRMFEGMKEWANWFRNTAGADLIKKWQDALGSLPGVSRLVGHLANFKAEIDPQKYAAQGGAVLHIVWPLLQAASTVSPWIIEMEPNSDMEYAWQKLRAYVRPIIGSTISASKGTYGVLKSWVTYDLPRLITRRAITQTSSQQTVDRSLPEELKKPAWTSGYTIFEDYGS